ncbi:MULTISPECIES: SH3 domain-containing protein [Bacillaceae]|uniref:SH3 domain-containing protein n=1 Tax=Evansella alkalicola TaxID=745819 RepID=A0ABS6K210_9BACI|nr:MULTISPECIES: SH3 domain-containing protein [Bacillaceae]MBU9723567.1 SH3 domain-containing protein [Bacillus alkalicola]
MKQLIILVTLSLFFTLTACGNNSSTPTESSHLTALNILTQKNTLIKVLDIVEIVKPEEVEEEASELVEEELEEEEKTITVHEASGTYYVNTGAANIRAGDGTSYDVIGSLRLNHEVEVKGTTDNGWYLFDFNGNDGYISGTLLADEKIEVVVVEETESSETASTSSSSSSSNSSNSSSSSSNSSNSSNSDSSDKKKESSPESLIAKTNVAKTTDQILTVVSTGGGNAKIEYWKKSGDKWKREMSTSGFVGSNGVSNNKVEGDRKAPTGVFGMPFAFGQGSNPGTKMEYRQITKNSYWISNVDDPQYNTWQERESSDKADEHLSKYTQQYKYAIALDYNMHNPVPGKGSAIFLHVSNGTPTLGCVSVPESQMLYLMKELKNTAKIIITSSESNIANY